ncbi:MAG: 23S rRNA (uracil(1939)-C(5))-methyltransferase RlmD [Coriobacteriales bacterium]|jgi:23S rRNA (uracil1939-C5)-methyltransferase|nr:23S rRNA (uracil(1939)-C(5))-methyltransferase RlmD [Coriobacteriales bacterium]
MDGHENVRITALAYGGEGIARRKDGKVVLVEATAVGDLVRVRTTDERRKVARARIEEVVEASPERVDARCPYHAQCGGCGLQHLSYAAQLRHKRAFVVEALERIGRIDDAEGLVANTVASPVVWGYRNKVELEPCRVKGKLALGLHAKGAGEVVPIQRCLLLPAGHEGLPSRLAGALGFALKDADAPLRRVGVRVSRTSGDVELALWTEPGPCNRSFVAKVLADALKATSLVRVLAAGDKGRREVKNVEVLSGRGHWREDVGGLRYRVSAPSFFQVNSAVSGTLVAEVLEGLGEDTARVADLYSGVGTFTLPLARHARTLDAVETAGSSIRDLRRNLSAHGLDAEVHAGSVEWVLPKLGKKDGIVVDPPRSGLGPDALDALADAAPRTVVYVSCDPATLARDVQRLAARGYRLVKAVPLDLFPQTWHVETVARLVAPLQKAQCSVKY